jgi:DNA-binding FadR family transcriptional regulator
LELRLSVEVESAGLCARRCTNEEATNIRSLMEKFDAQHGDPESVEVHYDFSFHLAIAKATKNPYFYSFLKFLEPIIVPRFRLSHLVSPNFQDKYYSRIHDEHEAIVAAIEVRDATQARSNMHLHLMNSLERLRALSKAAGLEDHIDETTPQMLQFAESLNQ